MMIARPIAASPAAIVITKIEKICPVRSESLREKAIRFRFTAFNISSIDIRTVRKLRRTSTPMNPIVKIRKESASVSLIVIVIGSSSRLPSIHLLDGAATQHHRAHDRDEEEDRRDLEREQ